MTSDSTNPEKSKKQGCSRMNTYESIKSYVEEENARGKSIRAIARNDFPTVDQSVIQRIFKGIEPQDPHIRIALGLPAYILAPVCLKCGEVHVTKRCTNHIPKKRPVQHEHNEQAALFQLIGYFENVYPEMKNLFAIPNGGHRNKATAGKMKAEGVKRGVPDMMLPVARGKFHGMFIEMKAGKNTTSPEQKEWITFLQKQGYYTLVAYSSQDAFDALVEYITLTLPSPKGEGFEGRVDTQVNPYGLTLPSITGEGVEREKELS